MLQKTEDKGEPTNNYLLFCNTARNCVNLTKYTDVKQMCIKSIIKLSDDGELHFGLLRLPNFVHLLSFENRGPTTRKLHPFLHLGEKISRTLLIISDRKNVFPITGHNVVFSCICIMSCRY